MGNLAIIEKAKEYLSRRPVDSTHGLDHHETVVQNCVDIVQAEHLFVDIGNLVIAAWWHDLESQEGATDLLQKEMASVGFDKQTAEVILAIVRSHTYGKHQETIEAKVLFDADKMEYFNPERMTKATKDAQMGLLPIPVLARHYHEWRNRYQSVLNSFNFEYSRAVAHRNLATTLDEIEKMRIFLETVKPKD